MTVIAAILLLENVFSSIIFLIKKMIESFNRHCIQNLAIICIQIMPVCREITIDEIINNNDMIRIYTSYN